MKGRIVFSATAVPAGGRLRGAGDDAEKYCVRCSDWWPATPEYFFRAAANEGGLFYCCKACYADWRATHPRLASVAKGSAE